MKKCLAIILTFVFLLGTWTVPVFAGEISSVTAEIDSNKLVTVKGIISTGAGQVVNIKITDPKGQLEYADSIISYGAGSFQASYTMTNNESGKYNVLVNALGASSALASFSYGTDNTLKGLAISKGIFDKAFSPETNQYAVNVDSRVDSITVTPTVNDSTATVKVNGTAVISGAPSGSISLEEGDNAVDIAVTSLSGETNTYTITITKWGVLSSGLTAEASIDGEKNVTVSGTISSGPGQAVTLKITDPDGNPEYAGNIISAAGGQFSFTYKLSNTINGRYTAALGGIGISTPVSTYFDYFDMQSITVSGITLKPGFQKDVTAYTAIAQGSVRSITVTPTAGGSNANISVNSVKVASGTASGPITLQSGANIVSVVLHGQDGVSCKTYTITVARDVEFVESGTVEAIISDDKLVDITGTIGADPGRQVTVMVRDPKGKVDYLGTSATTEGGAFKVSYPLVNEEQGEYSVNVGAKDLLGTLSASFTYLLDSADLSGLEISKGSLSPAFDKDTTSYRTKVDHVINKIKVTPYAVDPLATIEVNGSTVKSGKDSGSISLKEGPNTISIVVTASSGKEKTYKIIVTKESPPKSGNAYDR